MTHNNESIDTNKGNCYLLTTTLISNSIEVSWMECISVILLCLSTFIAYKRGRQRRAKHLGALSSSSSSFIHDEPYYKIHVIMIRMCFFWALGQMIFTFFHTNNIQVNGIVTSIVTGISVSLELSVSFFLLFAQFKKAVQITCGIITVIVSVCMAAIELYWYDELPFDAATQVKRQAKNYLVWIYVVNIIMIFYYGFVTIWALYRRYQYRSQHLSTHQSSDSFQIEEYIRSVCGCCIRRKKAYLHLSHEGDVKREFFLPHSSSSSSSSSSLTSSNHDPALVHSMTTTPTTTSSMPKSTRTQEFHELTILSPEERKQAQLSRSTTFRKKPEQISELIGFELGGHQKQAILWYFPFLFIYYFTRLISEQLRYNEDPWVYCIHDANYLWYYLLFAPCLYQALIADAILWKALVGFMKARLHSSADENPKLDFQLEESEPAIVGLIQTTLGTSSNAGGGLMGGSQQDKSIAIRDISPFAKPLEGISPAENYVEIVVYKGRLAIKKSISYTMKSPMLWMKDIQREIRILNRMQQGDCRLSIMDKSASAPISRSSSCPSSSTPTHPQTISVITSQMGEMENEYTHTPVHAWYHGFCYDVPSWFESPTLFMLFDYCKYGDLAKFMEHFPFTIDNRLDLIWLSLQLLYLVQSLHDRHHILHLDLKLENIGVVPASGVTTINDNITIYPSGGLITNSGDVKSNQVLHHMTNIRNIRFRLIDFGNALEASSSPRLSSSSSSSSSIASPTSPTSMLHAKNLYPQCPSGTLEYCSPEQQRGDELFTSASDVYSIGAVFRRLLRIHMNNHYTSLHTPDDEIKRHQNHRHSSVIGNEFNVEFNEIIDACCQTDPLRRPSIATMIEQVKSLYTKHSLDRHSFDQHSLDRDSNIQALSETMTISETTSNRPSVSPSTPLTPMSHHGCSNHCETIRPNNNDVTTNVTITLKHCIFCNVAYCSFCFESLLHQQLHRKQ